MFQFSPVCDDAENALAKDCCPMRLFLSTAFLAITFPLGCLVQAQSSEKTTTTEAAGKPAPDSRPERGSADAVTEGSITVGGQRVNYRAVAGTITVGASDPQDAMLTWDGKLTSDAATELPPKPQDRPATARMFYTAYLRRESSGGKGTAGNPNDPAGDAANAGTRPVTFIYNGGPGSPTMYMHMGAFGPRRVLLEDLQHPVGGPYRLIDNQFSLLDVSDLVFIDAPGAGFSRVQGQNAMTAFYGVDEDAHAFDRFVRKWLSKNRRWTSPKFLFGESYGTTRSAVLADVLARGGTDLNGVILLSQILNFNDTADGPEGNPGTEQAYFLSLPSFAATSWFHKRVPNAPADVEAFLREVETFALGEYAAALLQGADLSAERKQAIAARLAGYTGIPAATWLKADLRMSGGQFSALLQGDSSITTGRLDSRFEGPALQPLMNESEYDPFTNAVTASFYAGMNQYARTELHYGDDLTYKTSAREPGFHWNNAHRSPISAGWEGTLNVMPDLADAMKKSPRMHVLLMGGYFDLGTLYFGATYEMKHLPMPAGLQQNIAYKWFQTGHMVYVNEPSLKQLHDATAAFITVNSRGR